MFGDYARIIVICAAAIVASIILGNGAVWFFNKMPGKWLCDYGKEPDEELERPTVQRIKSVPWKGVFTGLFIVIGIKMGMDNPVYAIAAMAAIWLLVEMSIADIKYRIVPDQFIMLLVVTALGFIPFHSGGTLSCLWGALAGFGVMLIIGVIGKLIYKKDTLGGGDIKLFAALGLACGLDGIIIIFILTTIISAAHMVFLIATRRATLKDSRPMVPYIAASAIIYLVILHEISYNILIHL